MSTTANPGGGSDWRNLYEAAVLELDRRRLSIRIEEALQAISQRLSSIDGTNQAEKEPLCNALLVLQDLRKIDAEEGANEAA